MRLARIRVKDKRKICSQVLQLEGGTDHLEENVDETLACMVATVLNGFFPHFWIHIAELLAASTEQTNGATAHASPTGI